jgi:hypothetical protein
MHINKSKLTFTFQLRYQVIYLLFIHFLFRSACFYNCTILLISIGALKSTYLGTKSQLFILLCTHTIMVLNTLIYIALVIIVIIVIVVLLRFLFNVLLVMPVTLEHDYVVKYAASIYLPS